MSNSSSLYWKTAKFVSSHMTAFHVLPLDGGGKTCEKNVWRSHFKMFWTCQLPHKKLRLSDCGSSSSNSSTGAFTGSERASWKLDPDNSLWSTSSGFNMSEADGFLLCASCNINKANYRKHPDLLILKLSKVCEWKRLSGPTSSYRYLFSVHKLNNRANKRKSREKQRWHD